MKHSTKHQADELIAIFSFPRGISQVTGFFVTDHFSGLP
jgi:hypothetical protein